MQSSRIRAEVQVDGQLIVPRNRKSVKIVASALVHNDSDEHYVLGAPDSASAHCWQILDANGREIAREAAGKPKKARRGTEPFVSSMVPSNHNIRETETIEIAASKLKHGARYTVRHDHWGYIAEADFVVVHEPERAAAPKKAPKKRAKKAKRKVAKKKAAAKKVAKKAKRKPVAKKKAAAKKKVARKKTSRRR